MSLSTQAALSKDNRTGAATPPAMQHRHFAFIAKTIKDTADDWDVPNDLRYAFAEKFAVRLRSSNRNFDYHRFLKACGVED